MRTSRSIGLGGALLTLGYLMGVMNVGAPRSVTAQEAGDAVSEETGNKIRAAYRSLRDAKDALEGENRYKSATQGLNAFLILSGGGDAAADLESGNGVDPETFAALYAGQATDEIKDLLGYDEDGRLTYNGQVVRLYPKSKLQRLYAERVKINELAP